MRYYYVYILTNWNGKVLYIGITSDLERRIYEHKNGLIKGFTSKYYVNRLVYFEQTTDVNAAITREKQLKGWTREKKNRLVESVNPEWKDLSLEWRKVDSSLRSE
jgi:putative endonuclease